VKLVVIKVAPFTALWALELEYLDTITLYCALPAFVYRGQIQFPPSPKAALLA
jgi:hypothetical protein